MPGNTTKITNREKAAVLMMAFGVLDNWTECFTIAEQRPEKEVQNMNYLSSLVSRWKQSDKVKNQLAEYQKMIADIAAEERRKAREDERRKMEEERERESQGDNESTNGESKNPVKKKIDYESPAEQKALLNKIIQDSQDDPKTQLDALKVIQAGQKDDRQAARERKQVQFYLPLVCTDCILYQKARKKLEKDG